MLGFFPVRFAQGQNDEKQIPFGNDKQKGGGLVWLGRVSLAWMAQAACV
jgi:hypothetical protein